MLSDNDITQLRDALEKGKPPTVWFTGRAVGVDPGKSGKVVSFASPEEGDFIEVKPTGSQDTLSFSKAELTLTRPKQRPAPKKQAAPAAASAPAPAPAPVEEQIYQPEQPQPAEKKKPTPRRRTVPPSEVTVTLHSTPRGDWTVDVVVGKKRSVRAMPIPAAAIHKIAKELPNQVEDAISAVMAAARQQHEERIAFLQAELDAARRSLNELT
ncbi:DUF6319 family protein [Kibdelosporangium phytohabitans]|uniref:Cell wall anchor protein n=1 Tax=Kibdelosporangium phytohabitans TaxID=860235 RepID=A0A0N9HSW9_9PSEU|nr:DUF6319 family protein [Kibdelosporangium phytohabitans]ALG08044.1 hypothetical protein AOZ06_14955 [Kibdelosporangium phytohabitans]MBE1470994.1 type IV secretory pathway VirB10-like protein [Kibdelosporangium phytohabitans]